MKKIISRFLVVALLAVPATLSHAKIVRVVEKSFAVESGGTLTVKTSGGDVRVKIGDSNDVHVVARQKFKTNDEEKADTMLENLDLTMQSTSEGVELAAKYNAPKRWFGRGSSSVQVSFDVIVPASFQAELRTSGGDIRVGNLSGAVDAHTSGGDISMEAIGGKVNAHTSGGDIVIKGAGGDVHLRTSGGDILVYKVSGTAVLSTSGGDIDIGEVSGAIRARTSGGDVSARIKGALTEDSKLSTSGGDVAVTVDEGIKFSLDASTTGGRINASDVTIKIKSGGSRKHRLAGEVNGGGPILKLRTSGGDIAIVTR